MNRLKKLTFISFLCALLSFPFLFAACSSNTLKYRLSDNEEFYYVSAYDKDIKGEITIPATYNDKEVRIDNAAFKDCKNITSIILSEGIKIAGAEPFSGCKSLTSIDIPKSFEAFKGVYPIAVNEYKNLTINYAGTINEWYHIDGAPYGGHGGFTGVQVVCTDGVAFDTRETAN